MFNYSKSCIAMVSNKHKSLCRVAVFPYVQIFPNFMNELTTQENLCWAVSYSLVVGLVLYICICNASSVRVEFSKANG